MARWVAISYGALDLKGTDLFDRGFELVVAPVHRGSPAFLFGSGADVWRALIESPLDDAELDLDVRETLFAFESMGIASRNVHDPFRLDRLDAPWLLSPLHELVYALLDRVAHEHGIPIVFIKGPTLHAQGLRVREHSGDVDCWVLPGDDLRLAEAMSAWGWTPLYSAFSGTGVQHALTLRAGEWGCAIDVHCRFPGMNVAPDAAFEEVRRTAETRRFASISVSTPAASAHAVITALHEMRPFSGTLPSPYQVDAARHALSAAGEEVIGIVDVLRAGYALDVPLRLAFPERDVRSLTYERPEDWTWRLMAPGPRQHMVALRSVPPLQRVRVLLRLAWPSAKQMRIAYEIPDASAWELTRMRLRRAAHSIRRLTRLR
ncbi:ABC-type proline/glycine betaine transport systems [Microbacterium sp. HM58-2]|nr:ABC-type proline/glycine betaine transport systems [Microbacterium sp. HM58-2]